MFNSRSNKIIIIISVLMVIKIIKIIEIITPCSNTENKRKGEYVHLLKEQLFFYIKSNITHFSLIAMSESTFTTAIPQELQQTWDDHNVTRNACVAWGKKK